MASIRTIATIVLSSLLLAGCSRRPEPEPKPESKQARRDVNVLLVTIDTLRADYLSCYGSPAISTPSIDRLAARGVRFDQAFVQVPLTAPSHASILTGTYPKIHNLRDMGGFVLDARVPTLATILGQAGLQTAAFIGAAVLDHSYGLNRGFSTYADEMKNDAGDSKVPGVVAEVRGEMVTRRALEWLDRRDGSRSFLLWAHYYDPHFPYDPPQPFRGQYPKNSYGGEVAYTDEQVGRLLEGLRDRRVLDNTLVVLMADHGESLGEHGEYTHGVFLYDATMRIPLIVAGPGVPAGRVVSQQVRSIDVLPTIAEFLDVSAGGRAQGVSLWPAIAGGKRVETNDCYMETIYPKTRLGWSELRGMRTDEWKLIVGPKPELYRVVEDRVEQNNLVAQHPAEADRLRKKMWESAESPQDRAELKPQPVDEERRRQLQALGYLNVGRRPVRLDMSGPDPKDRIAILEALERAADALNQDRYRPALQLLEKIAPEDRTNPLIYTYLGLCYQRLNQFDKAESTYLEAIRQKADSDETHAELGEIYVRNGALERAVESMERAAALNPANLDNMNNLANAYLQLGRPEQCERVLRAILTQNDRHAAAHNLFGIVEVQRGRPAEARGHFERAVECNPDLAEGYMNLGLLAQNAGQIKPALAYYRQFLKRANPRAHGDFIPKVKAAVAQLEREAGS